MYTSQWDEQRLDEAKTLEFSSGGNNLDLGIVLMGSRNSGNCIDSFETKKHGWDRPWMG